MGIQALHGGTKEAFMTTISGTTGTDSLIGTSGDDIFIPYGVTTYGAPDYMSGGDGADTYQLTDSYGASDIHRYIIDDAGTDGATDTITGAGALVYSGTLGYAGYATAVRVGDDLIINTPYRPGSFRDAAKPAYEITVTGHYAGTGVEFAQFGGVSYALATTDTGSSVADLLAGTNGKDVLRGLGGDDYISANDGNDKVYAGAGNDIVRGGNGRDRIFGGDGDDYLFGQDGNDVVKGQAGNDTIKLGSGNDRGIGGAGNDYIYGQDGDDILKGGGGDDMLSAGRGNDQLFGGRGADTYRIGYDLDGLGSLSDMGHNIIHDKGQASGAGSLDTIEIFGLYGPSSGGSADAFARMSFDTSGLDMVLSLDGGASSVTVQEQFGADRYGIETIQLNAGYWQPITFQILDGAKVNIGDDRGGLEIYNEVLFGTDGNDLIFGAGGTNFIVSGGGSDTIIFKEVDPQPSSGMGGGASNNIVEDFDTAFDHLDFSEIAGLTMGGLTITEDAEGDAHIAWYSGTFEIADVFIELRGVGMAELTPDLFIFA